MNPLRVLVIAGAIAGASASARAQRPIPIRTTTQAVRAREPVSDIIELRELADHSVLANIPFQLRVIVFDPTLNSFRVLMDTTAAGSLRNPGSAFSIVPFGDSTLIPDMSARAFVMVGPNGEVGRSVAAPNGRDFARMSAYAATGKPGADAQGRVVYQAPVPNPLIAPPGMGFKNDSLPTPLLMSGVLRADFATRLVDTLARVIILGARRYPGMSTPSVSTVVNPLLPAIDDWAVLSDGSVAVVRGHDYHIDWVLADGNRTTPAMPFDWRRVTDVEKRAKLDSARRILDSLRSADADPYVITTFTAAGKTLIHPRLDYITPDQMPDYLPPIRSAALHPDADGNLWILPTTSAQASGGLLYDVVNTRGELFQRVQLPAGRLVAGFGRGGVIYLVVKDSNGLWYLERTKLAQ